MMALDETMTLLSQESSQDATDNDGTHDDDDEMKMDMSRLSDDKVDLSKTAPENCFSGGLVMIMRPKGGYRSLCMDKEEVEACRDLGFELEYQRTVELELPDSPIIARPGDDPRDVKARLKAWAQAVALASAARQRFF